MFKFRRTVLGNVGARMPNRMVRSTTIQTFIGKKRSNIKELDSYPVVELKKGIEDDNVIYEVRAKLFRFDPSTKEWKERGTGNITILQNKLNPKQVRVIMWREQVLKLACNHLILRNMVIEFAKGSDNYLRWTAVDHAECQEKLEKFLCKFGNEKNCSDFKHHFEEMVLVINKMSEEDGSSTSASIKPEEGVSSSVIRTTPDSTNNKPLSEMFKKEEGSWECKDCYTSNKKTAIACAACTAPKPGSSPPPPVTHSATKNPFTSCSSKSVTFGDIGNQATTTNIFGASPAKGSQPFEGAGTPLFGFGVKKPDSVPNTSSPVAGNEDEPEEFVPTAEFQPVIPLPPLVEVKKGIEDDNVIYEVRAKLFRFDPSVKEWKERGTGNIKILQNKLSPKQVRVIMWREQVLKLACNHLISRNMVIEFAKGSDKHLTWTAIDHAENDGKLEKFLCKFGSEKNCSEFKQHFEEMVLVVTQMSEDGGSTSAPVTTPEEGICGSGISTTDSTDNKPFSEMFKKEEGSWECNDCYTSNKKTAIACAACTTLKPGSSPPPPVTQSEKENPFTTFSFKPISFGDIGNQAATTNIFGDSPTKGNQPFEGAGTALFGFAIKKPDASVSNTSISLGGNEDEPEEFVPTAEFQPVIPLPPLVEVKKGIEVDNVIYEVRAKLFRFDPSTKEWKERGTGNIKILQNKLCPKQVRVTMWREQVLKLACNHLILRNMVIEFAKGSDKYLTWTAVDHAETNGKLEKLLCKFGNEKNCSDFKHHFEEMVLIVNQMSGEDEASTSAGDIKPEEGNVSSEINRTSDSGDNKENVSQTETTEESKCPGCRGCNSDDFDFSKLEGRTLPSYAEQTMTVSEYLEAKKNNQLRPEDVLEF